MNIQGINTLLLQLPLPLIVGFWDLKMHSNMWYTLDYFFGWPDDDSLESKHVALSNILCNKLLCLTETPILYVLKICCFWKWNFAVGCHVSCRVYRRRGYSWHSTACVLFPSYCVAYSRIRNRRNRGWERFQLPISNLSQKALATRRAICRPCFSTVFIPSIRSAGYVFGNLAMFVAIWKWHSWN